MRNISCFKEKFMLATEYFWVAFWLFLKLMKTNRDEYPTIQNIKSPLIELSKFASRQLAISRDFHTNDNSIVFVFSKSKSPMIVFLVKN